MYPLLWLFFIYAFLGWCTEVSYAALKSGRFVNYSQEPFNLGGYICLRFSAAWGLACLFVVKLVHPSVLWCIRTIPHPVGVGLLILFSVTMAVDLAATVRTIARINRQLSQLDELAAGIKGLPGPAQVPAPDGPVRVAGAA